MRCQKTEAECDGQYCAVHAGARASASRLKAKLEGKTLTAEAVQVLLVDAGLDLNQRRTLIDGLAKLNAS